MFDSLTSQAAIALLNRWLAREAWARERLAPFAGRVARLALPPFAVVFAVAPEGTLAALPTHPHPHPDVTLTADTTALPFLWVDTKALLRNVKLQGDAEFAQALGFVLQNLKPEPEEDLAPWMGDAAAVRVVGLVRAAFAQLSDMGKRLSTATADYLVAEEPILASKQDVDDFVQAVNALRDATARVQAHVEQLSAEIVAAEAPGARQSKKH